MKVTIRNIGAISEATIDLNKGLSIFCGPNNTGKTYLAYCLYGLHKLREPDFHFFSSKYEDFKFANGEGSVNIIEYYKRQRTHLKNFLERQFQRSLGSIFGLSNDSTKKTFPDAQLTVSLPNDESFLSKLLAHQISLRLNFPNGPVVTMQKQSGNPIVTIAYILKENKSETSGDPFVEDYIFEHLQEVYLSYLLPKAFIAPVERNSIFTFSKELAIQRNELVDEMLRLKDGKTKSKSPNALLERRAMRYPMPVRDGLEIAEDLATFQKQTSQYNYLAEALEEDLLKGKVIIGKEGEVLFSSARAKGVKLPIHLGASVVKSLSGLVIYFRHLAEKGDFIIIDEPELNLHPDAQIVVARIIARIVNEGFKVLINTHSDYIIKELNNLMMLSALQEAKVENVPAEYKVQQNVTIRPEVIGAYLFHYQTGKAKNKVAVDILPIETNGFEVETIDKVIGELNSISQELYYQLENIEGEKEDDD